MFYFAVTVVESIFVASLLVDGAMDRGLRPLLRCLHVGPQQQAESNSRALEVQPVQVASQLGLDDAGVHGVRGDGRRRRPRSLEPPRQLLAEEHVGELALLVRPERLVRSLRVEVIEVNPT